VHVRLVTCAASSAFSHCLESAVTPECSSVVGEVANEGIGSVGSPGFRRECSVDTAGIAQVVQNAVQANGFAASQVHDDGGTLIPLSSFLGIRTDGNNDSSLGINSGGVLILLGWSTNC